MPVLTIKWYIAMEMTEDWPAYTSDYEKERLIKVNPPLLIKYSDDMSKSFFRFRWTTPWEVLYSYTMVSLLFIFSESDAIQKYDIHRCTITKADSTNNIAVYESNKILMPFISNGRTLAYVNNEQVVSRDNLYIYSDYNDISPNT